MTRYFITGGFGFLGQYIVQAIHEHDLQGELWVLTRTQRKTFLELQKLERVKWVHGESTQPQSFVQHLEGVDTAKHSAAMVSFPRTIQTWSKRYGWREAANKATVILSETKTPALAVKVAAASARVRQHLADDLESQADGLKRRKHGRTIKEALSRAELARRLADASNKVFQWDQQSATGLVSVETLLDLDARPDQPALPSCQAPTLELPAADPPPQVVPQDAEHAEPDPGI